MPAAPLPPDEPERLAALARYEILDTAADPRIEAMVRLASGIHAAPIAAVSLLDEGRQWFKAIHGLDIRETPREQAFCAHAILDPSNVTVIDDATKDARFADNPLVTGEPHIRFYAGAPLLSAEGQPIGMLCIIDRQPRTLDEAGRQHLTALAAGVSSAMELHRLGVELERAATHDALTGLLNVLAFGNALEEAVGGALTGMPCALLVGDVDHLRAVNEAHGRAAGDTLLRQVASRLRRAVRGGDLVARLGGNEFAVLMTAPVDDAGMAAVATRIAAEMACPFGVADRPANVGMTLGGALCPIDATDPGGLLRAAERARAAAKERHQPWLQAGQGHPPARRRQPEPEAATESMVEDLRSAIAGDLLALHWQPVFRAADGALVGHEALLRWNRHGHGWISPAVAVPVAEASGLIARLDTWVLHTACRSAAAGAGGSDVAVNLSAHWFGGGGDLGGLLGRALERSRLPARRLVIELTERTLVASSTRALDQIRAAQALGVRVALDDFGTGYSSLGYLQRFRFDKLKLDRAFVSPVTVDARSDAVARSILALGHDLGMTVVAEGVETRDQLRFLRDEGCDELQGFLLGRPAAEPANDAADPIFWSTLALVPAR